MRVHDYYPVDETFELVDIFTIPFDNEQRANSEFSSLTTYSGECGSARIALSIGITSLCPPDTYGPRCDVFCEEVPGNSTCNYLGEVVCEGNFREPDCIECDPNFEGPNCEDCTYIFSPQDFNTIYPVLYLHFLSPQLLDLWAPCSSS